MTTPTRTDARRWGRLVALLLAGTVLLAACGASDRDFLETGSADGGWGGDDTAFDEGADAEMPAEEAEAVAEDRDSAPAPPSTGGPAPEGMPRAVIRTGTMHIRATDTTEVADRVVELVEEAGGYVAGTDLTRDDEGVVQGSFTFRVPTDELTAVLDAFDDLADAVLERRLDETDVTTQLVDLDAEVANLEAFETELRELLTEVRESGADAEDLLSVFDRINSVRAEIDQAAARRTMLTDQVAMSTVYLRLSPTASTGPVGDPGWDPGGTARAALASTVRALTTLADGAIRVGLTVLPVTLVLLAPVALVLWLLRRWWKRRPRPEPAAPPAPAWSAPTATPPPPAAPMTSTTTPDDAGRDDAGRGNTGDDDTVDGSDGVREDLDGRPTG
jgi:hypothetical protein